MDYAASNASVLKDLTSGFAHAFNNLLTSASGYVALARESAAIEQSPRVAAQLVQAENSCRRASDLVRQLLVYSHGVGVAAEPADLGACVVELLSALPPSAVEGIDLSFHLQPGTPPVLVDTQQFGKALSELLKNARDALARRAGRRAAEIAVAAVQAHDVCSSCGQEARGLFAEVSICDNGPGMSEENASMVFRPFFTTKTAGVGHGMGLPVVHGIVHAMGGHITLATLAGEGTLVRLLLPFAAACDAPAVD